MYNFNLPFNVIGACRQSFKIRFGDGQEAYISNECMLMLMNNPKAAYRVVSNELSNGHKIDWVEVALFTRGIKPARRPMYDECGNLIK